MQRRITFISYSRRQLYFAEALALHLQKAGIDVWFDLQELQAGTVWSDGLEQGVREAGQMVLVVSKASLASTYTQAEWKGFNGAGRRLVLAVFEPVDLPDELRSLPSYDFRGGFDGKLRELAAFLKGQAEPRHDPVASPNRFDMSLRLPGVIWLTLAAQFGGLIACLLGWLIALSYRGLGQAAANPVFWILTALSLAVGARYAVPLLRHRLEYRQLKRSALVNLLLLVPAAMAVAFLGQASLLGDPPSDTPGGSYLYRFLVAGTALLELVAYFVLFRRSAGLLRWMLPEEDLQALRRRVHQPLVAQASFDVDCAAQGEGKAVTVTIHADPADEPAARWVEAIFKQAGHTRVAPEQRPAHHIAILSNRSSAAWVHALTQAHAGQFVFVVISTIEFGEHLSETGRYQWVDARDGDPMNISGLARSLAGVGAWKREAALEATPAMIDRWKVPPAVTVLKRTMEVFAIYVLVYGLTGLVGFLIVPFMSVPQNPNSSAARSVALVAVGLACFLISGRALIYRRVSAPMLYGFFVGSAVLAGLLGTMVRLREQGRGLRSEWWLEPALLLAVVLPVVIYSALGSRHWLPAVAPKNADEVGIKRSIDRAFRRRSVITIAVWVIMIVALAVGIYVTLMRPA